MRSRSRLGPTPVPRDLTEASRFTFSAIYDSVRRVISVGGRGGEATGRSSEGSAAAGAGSDHRSGPSAGAAGARDRLAVSRQAVCRRVHGRSGAAAAADPAGGGAVHLKHMHDLSDEVLCARWLENPYYQFFCGELSFCHELPFDRSSMTHWRQRLGEAELVALLQESLSVAHKTGALATRDLERVVVDTTVQPGPAPAKAGGDRPSDRRAALPPGARKTGRPGAAQQREAAPELSPGGQAREIGRAHV